MSCGNCDQKCDGRTYCNPFKDKVREYDGVRFTADGFDCALPVSMDTYNSCSFDCLYCFSNYLSRDPSKKVGETNIGKVNLKKIEKFLDFDNPTTGEYKVFQDALRRKKGYRCPVQWGALGDPFDNIERWQQAAKPLIELFNKYNQPVRVSTKGGLLLQDKDYLSWLSKRPELYWFSFSIISPDDEIMRIVDRRAPVPSDRIKAMKELNKIGIKTSLRMRPILPFVSDCSSKPAQWRDLIDQCAEAGAEAISMEFVYIPGAQPPQIKARMKMMDKICKKDLTKFYKETTDVWGSCLRSSKWWKEDLVFAVRDRVKKNGMTFAISDPHWKELNETGCCCGIQPDDKVFGNWQRESATNRLIEAKKDFEKGGPGLVYFKDINPPWSNEVILIGGCIMGSGPKAAWSHKHEKWENKLRNTWNNVKSPRAPFIYFGGVLKPIDKLDKEGNLIYRYVAQERKNLKGGWSV